MQPSPREENSCVEQDKLTKEIADEALRWVRNNQDLTIKENNYTSPRISSEIPDCSMPMSFDSFKFCSFGCQYCVISGTYISAEHGRKTIEKLKIGDRVYSYNIESKKVELDVVLQTMVRETSELLEIELENGVKITITPEHPVYVLDKGWVEAKDLNEHDDVQFIKRPGTAFSMTNNNPMKNPATSKKQGETLRESFASGELEELRAKVKISGTANLLKWNSSDEGRQAVSQRMTENNPMDNPESAAKMGATMHQKWENGELTSHFTGVPRPDVSERMSSDKNPMKDPVKRKKTLQKIVKSWIANGRISKGEIKVGEALELLGVNFDHQHVVDGPSRNYVLDFFLKDANLCIEYDGHSNHYHPAGIETDGVRDAYILKNYGTKTIRIHRDEAFIGKEPLSNLISRRMQP